jgi:hypothetical protein
MTTAAINKRIDELRVLLDTVNPASNEWDKYYSEYNSLCDTLQRRYCEEQEPKLMAYYKKYIQGKTWEEASVHWDFFSDWHKDCYGYRPRWVGDMAVGDK